MQNKIARDRPANDQGSNQFVGFSSRLERAFFLSLLCRVCNVDRHTYADKTDGPRNYYLYYFPCVHLTPRFQPYDYFLPIAVLLLHQARSDMWLPARSVLRRRG